MADYYIPPNVLARVFPAGTFPGHAALDDLHNVSGGVIYQIGGAAPVNAHFNINDPPIVVPVNGVAFTVTNQMASELKVSG